MKILSLACMSLVLCLFAGVDRASAADSISGTSYNFVPTDYSRGEARVVKTSLPSAPAPAPAPAPESWASVGFGDGTAVLTFLFVCVLVIVGIALLL